MKYDKAFLAFSWRIFNPSNADVAAMAREAADAGIPHAEANFYPVNRRLRTVFQIVYLARRNALQDKGGQP